MEAHTIPTTYRELFPSSGNDTQSTYLNFSLYTSSSKFLRHTSVKVLCDNSAVVYILNNLTAKDSKVMYSVRRLVLKMLKHTIHIHATHLPGDENILCDALTQQTHTVGLLAAYGMDHHPAPVPSTLRPHNWRLLGST